MLRFYQSDWQAIPFSSFAKLSFFSLAGADFYSAFYQCFFEKYATYEELPEEWRRTKILWAERIFAELLGNEQGEVLSVGCGLGFMEHYLMRKCPEIHLHCTEITSIPLRWLEPVLTKERLHFGYVPECLPQGLLFDLIYCGTIDYTIADAAWVKMLRALRNRLKPGGKLLVLTASLQQEAHVPRTLCTRFHHYRNQCRLFWRHSTKQEPVQFWGWMRTQAEYIASLEMAGFLRIISAPLGNNPSCRIFVAEA